MCDLKEDSQFIYGTLSTRKRESQQLKKIIKNPVFEQKDYKICLPRQVFALCMYCKWSNIFYNFTLHFVIFFLKNVRAATWDFQQLGMCDQKKALDQPAHTRSLIWAIASRLNILWMFGYWLNIILSF